MTESLVFGVMLLCLAGAMSATFSVPMKFTSQWEWEHIWGLGSFFALLTGWTLVYVALPDFLAIYQKSSFGTLLLTFLFGAGWGVGSILFGLGIHRVGVSLGVTLILSLNAVVGSVLPLLIQHPERIVEPAGLSLLVGLAVMIVGLLLLGLAGHKRDVELGKTRTVSTQSFFTGLVICIWSGLLSPLANFAFIFGKPLTEEAAYHHGKGLSASMTPWALAFAGCYGLNILYCVHLINARRSVRKLWRPGTAIYWLGALIMGTLWTGAMFTYGWGASELGEWGPYIGFPTLMISSIVFANVWGVILREWRQTSRRTKTTLLLGLATLLLAFVILGYANKLTQISTEKYRAALKKGTMETNCQDRDQCLALLAGFRLDQLRSGTGPIFFPEPRVVPGNLSGEDLARLAQYRSWANHS